MSCWSGESAQFNERRLSGSLAAPSGEARPLPSSGSDSMEDYFNYFTEIEEHWQQCRGTVTLLSPLDWALIESFQESGIPLEVVLRGMEAAFAQHAKRAGKIQKVNSLSYCSQAILGEFERFRESSVG